mmetsp:Transcript_12054/g.18511  ORF Transcript_12054/g.18511 Transcript_12054/m.18511 type:complete len:84 (-) Transcript_12054:380-631(-)
MIIEENNDLDIEEMEIKIGRIESRILRNNDFQGKAEEINLYRKTYDMAMMFTQLILVSNLPQSCLEHCVSSKRRENQPSCPRT